MRSALKLFYHRQYIMSVGKDMPEVEDWIWGHYHQADRQPPATVQSQSAAPSEEGSEGVARSDA
jgi:hypothetical protein